MNTLANANQKQRIWLIAQIVWLVSPCLAEAAPQPSREAKTRVALYQMQARAVLEGHHWRIVSDRPGRLLADATLGLTGTVFPGTYTGGVTGIARLTVTLQPKNATSTICAANVIAYYAINPDNPMLRKTIGPVPFNNPENTKNIQDMMIEAEKRMTDQHPDYRHPN